MKHAIRFFLIAFVVVSVFSCSPQPEANITEESALEDTADNSGTNTEEMASTDSEIEIDEEPASIPDKPLSEEGPWLIINSTQGLFAVNPDGSGLTQFAGRFDGPTALQKIDCF